MSRSGITALNFTPIVITKTPLVRRARVPPNQTAASARVCAASAAAAIWPVSHHSVKNSELKEIAAARSHPGSLTPSSEVFLGSLNQTKNAHAKKARALKTLVQCPGTRRMALPNNTAASILPVNAKLSPPKTGNGRSEGGDCVHGLVAHKFSKQDGRVRDHQHGNIREQGMGHGLDLTLRADRKSTR